MELGSIFLLLAVVLLVGIYVSSPLFTRSSTRDKSEDAPPKADESDFIPVQADHQDHSRSSLLAEYDRLLNLLQELEFDHALGKIPADEYPKQRALLMQSGAEVLQKLDAIQAAAPDTNSEEARTPATSATSTERFNAAVQARLAADSVTPPLINATPVPAATATLATNGDQALDGALAAGTSQGSTAPAAAKQAVQPAPVVPVGDGLDEPVTISDADLELLISARRQARHEKASGFCPNCGKPVQKSDRFCPKCGKAL